MSDESHKGHRSPDMTADASILSTFGKNIDVYRRAVFVYKKTLPVTKYRFQMLKFKKMRGVS